MKILTWSSFVVIFLVLASCDNHVGSRGVTGTIEESKANGVFIRQYTVNPNPFRINDTLMIHVKEAWLEQHWAFSGDAKRPILMEGFQLHIRSTENDLAGIDSKWTIGINGDLYLRASSKTSIIGDFSSLPGDSINFPVQTGSNLSDSSPKQVIGNFVIISD